MITPAATIAPDIRTARERLDAHVRDIVRWHFDPATGCPFWLDTRADARRSIRGTTIHGYDDLDRSVRSRTSGCAAGRCGAGCRRRTRTSRSSSSRPAAAPACRSRASRIEDFRIDYENFSETLPDEYFPKGADWLMVGPSGPRRLRLAVEHLAQHRGGICFMVDLDPRWVIKLIKMRQMEQVEAVQAPCDRSGPDAPARARQHQVPVHDAEAARSAVREGVARRRWASRGVFCGGTEMTPQFHRFAVEELLDGVYFAPTYGNTLMGLATHKPAEPEDNYAIIYYPPAPRAMIEVVDPDRPDRRRRLRRDGPRAPDHADQGILHAALPRTRRGRTRAAVPAVSVGRRPQRPSVFAVLDDSGGGRVLVGSRRGQGSGIGIRSGSGIRDPRPETRRPTSGTLSH